MCLRLRDIVTASLVAQLTVAFVAPALPLIAAAGDASLPISFAPDSNCTWVTESTTPYDLVKSGAGADKGVLTKSPGVSVNGYFAQNTIVKIDVPDASVSPIAYFQTGTFLPVTVVSAPPLETSAKVVYNGAVQVMTNQPGTGQRALPGMHGAISAADLMPSFPLAPTRAETLTQPGSQIFIVTKNSPLYKIPQFQGKAVRFTKDGDNYVTRQCCPDGIKAIGFLDHIENSFSSSQYEHISKRDTRCAYSPVFDLVQPNFSKSGQVTFDFISKAAICDSYVSSISPLNADNQRLSLALANVAPFPPSALTRLQQIALKAATVPRRSDSGHRYAGGNYSKGLCKQAVNDILVNFGLISQRIPGYRAEDTMPKLLEDGFRNVISQFPDPHTAPVPSVLVYSGGADGHIEVKVDGNAYCSDYCKETPRTDYDTNDKRTLIGVFVPPENIQ